MSRPLRIAAADDERDMRDYLSELLPRLGHEATLAESGHQLIELCRAKPPDLALIDIKLGDMDGLDAAAAINRERPVPVIVISAYHDADLRARARGDYVMAYLVKPIKQADLEAAIDVAVMRFECYQAALRDAADMRQLLEDRKIVERAKGVVMRRSGVSEEEAFRRLRKLSSNQNRRLIEVARGVMGAEEVFRELEQDVGGNNHLDHDGRRSPFGRESRKPAAPERSANGDKSEV